MTDILHLFENKFDTFDTSPSMEIKKIMNIINALLGHTKLISRSSDPRAIYKYTVILFSVFLYL